MHTTTHLTIAFLAFAGLTRAQIYPPAQGPPAVKEADVRDLAVAFITGRLTEEIEDKLAETNATLAQRNDVRATVRLSSLERYSPYTSQTPYTDRPNHRFVRIMHNLNLRLSGIKYKKWGTWLNYPWDRSISVSIDVDAFCSGWEVRNGTIAIGGKSWPPYLDEDPALSEEIVNAFLGGWLVDYINSQIRQLLDSGGPLSTAVSGQQCVSLGAFTGSPGAVDDAIRWNPPKVGGPPPGAEYNPPPATVRPIRVKRLPAHKLDGSVVYDPVESPLLNFWAGFALRQYHVPSLVEGQEALLPGPAIEVYPALKDGVALVVIAELGQDSGAEDSTYRVFSSATSYGAGTQTIVVGKTYWERLGPPVNQLFKRTVPAYEITFEVSAPPRTAQPRF